MVWHTLINHCLYNKMLHTLINHCLCNNEVTHINKSNWQCLKILTYSPVLQVYPYPKHLSDTHTHKPLVDCHSFKTSNRLAGGWSLTIIPWLYRKPTATYKCSPVPRPSVELGPFSSHVQVLHWCRLRWLGCRDPGACIGWSLDTKTVYIALIAYNLDSIPNCKMRVM